MEAAGRGARRPSPTSILVAGDAVAGFTFYGPYPTEAAALDAQADYEGQLRQPVVVAPLLPR